MWFTWRPVFHWPHLCPVLFSDRWGLVVIMRRAEQPVSLDDIEASDPDCYPDIDVEYKTENWGRVGGKVVCVDYGIPFEDFVTNRRSYLASRAPR